MDVDYFPLPEVDMKVEDVAINFDDGKVSYGNNPQCDTEGGCLLPGPYEFRNGSRPTRQESGYEAIDVHFLSTTKPTTTTETRRFQCEDCGKYFGRNDHLKNHRRTHTGERPYECDSCPRTFAKNFDLTRHKRYVHGTVMQFFICEECGRTFTRKDHLKSHLLTHKNQDQSGGGGGGGGKTFNCETCGRTYSRVENLKRHMEKHFEGIEGAEYVARAGGEGSGRCSIRASDSPAGKHHPCEFCGRLFSRKDHMRNHERTHTGERPFGCDQCEKRFAKRYVLTRHVQNVHKVNLRLYKCGECEREFTRNDHLKLHMKIHILKAMRGGGGGDAGGKRENGRGCGRVEEGGMTGS